MLFKAYICYTVFVLLDIAESKGAARSIVDIARTFFDDISSAESTDSEDMSREIRHYYKYLSKQEQKYYKEKFKKEMSQEEKEQVKYFDDLLQQVKKLNKNRRANYESRK